MNREEIQYLIWAHHLGKKVMINGKTIGTLIELSISEQVAYLRVSDDRNVTPIHNPQQILQLAKD